MQATQRENRERGYATVKEAAGYVRLSVAKLYQLMSQGDLPFVKVGKARRIAWDALDQMMQRNTQNGAGSV